MAKYNYDGLKVTVGAGFAFDMAGKYPLLTKRIFKTLEDAQAFVNDTSDSAIAGLVLTVTADTPNNGAYFVSQIASGTTTAGTLVKLSSTDGANFYIKKRESAEEGYFASYQLQIGDVPATNDNKIGDVINIPKDFLVKSAEVKTKKEGETEPADMTVGTTYIDFVINSKDDTGTTGTHLYLDVTKLVDVYSGSSSSTITTEISDTNVITANINPSGISGTHLSNSAVTTDKIAGSAITTSLIANGVVTNVKIGKEEIYGDVIKGSAITENKIANSAVTEDKIKDGNVTSGKLGLSAVTTDKIYEGAVTSGKIGNSAVTEDKINGSAVTESKIADSAVTSTKIAAGAVTTDKIANANVTGTKIASATVSGSNIALNTITKDNLNENLLSDLQPSYTGNLDSVSGYVSVHLDVANGKITSKTSITEKIASLNDAVGLTYNSATGKYEIVSGTTGDGLATAQDVATVITKDEEVIANALLDHETKISQLSGASKLDVVKTTTGLTDYIASYQLQQNGINIGEAINIPKDFLVKSGSVITSTGETGTEIGHTYIDFVINSKDDTGTTGTHLYIPVDKLVDVYSGSSSSTITTTVNDYKIEVKINDRGISNTMIADNAVQNRNIMDSSVTGEKIKKNTISGGTSGEIALNTITADNLANNAVTTAKILDKNVTTAKLADDLVIDCGTW